MSVPQPPVGPNPFDDRDFVIMQTLGSELSDGEQEKIRKAREDQAGREIVLLTTKSEEFNRRQGESNMGFAYSVLHRTGGFSIEPIDDHGYYSSVRESIETREPVSFVYHGDLSRSEIEGQDFSRTLAAVSSLRASAIWVRRDPYEVFTKHTIGESGYLHKSKMLDTVAPHLMVGHRYAQSESGHDSPDTTTELLLLPMIDLSNAESKENGFQTSVPRSSYYIQDLTIRRSILRVRMSTNQYKRLESLQIALLSSGLSWAEIEDMHDETTGMLTFKQGLSSSINTQVGKKLPRKEGEAQEYGIGNSRPFDMVIEENIVDKIHPDEFKGFHVMEGLERAASMLGVDEEFRETAEEFKEAFLEDPEITMLRTKNK